MAKNPGALAPDGSAYVALTDGAGSLGVSYYATATFTPQAASYTGGNILGVAKTLTWQDKAGNTFAGGLLWIVSAQILIAESALQASEGAYTLRKFSAARATPLTDNAAADVAAADIAKYQGDTALGTPTDRGAICEIRQYPINEPLWVPSTGITVAELFNAGTFTPTATGRIVNLLAVPG